MAFNKVAWYYYPISSLYRGIFPQLHSETARFDIIQTTDTDLNWSHDTNVFCGAALQLQFDELYNMYIVIVLFVSVELL